MEWLSQNWIWLALGVGTIAMMRRGGAGGCCGGHAGHDNGAEAKGSGSADGSADAGAASCCGGARAAENKPAETKPADTGGPRHGSVGAGQCH